MAIPAAVCADDFGSHGAVSTVRSDMRRLLAHDARAAGVDPKDVSISDVVVVGNEALGTWDFGHRHGIMGLVVRDDRWWDTYDAKGTNSTFWVGRGFPPLDGVNPYIPMTPDTSTLSSIGFTADLVAQAGIHNRDVAGAPSNPREMPHIDTGCSKCWSLDPQGGLLDVPRAFTADYRLTFHFSANDAPAALPITQVYARAPSAAEFLPNRPIALGSGYANAVSYFDLSVGGSKAVTFTPGTTIDVWFPFVLDDQLRYTLSFFSDDKPSSLIVGTIFDNTLHFVLPAFVMAPGKTLMAEIDGDPVSRS